MDAHQAAAALKDAEGYEEALTNRTGGMTNLVWGLAAPLIFLTYGAAGGLVLDGHEWVMALLWIPGALLGGILTATLWISHAVTLHHPVSHKDGWNHLGKNILIFLVLAAIIAAAAAWADLTWNMSVVMVLVNGAFAFVVAMREAKDAPACGRNTMVAGGFMLIAGLLLGFLAFGEPGSSLGGAAITALGWGGSGLWTFIRG